VCNAERTAPVANALPLDQSGADREGGMAENVIMVWPSVRRAFGLLWQHRRGLAAASLVPVMVVIATGMVLPFLGELLASRAGIAGVLVLRVLEAVLLSLAAALLITPAVRMLCGLEASAPLFAWSPAHRAVFWRALVLSLLHRAAVLLRAGLFATAFEGGGQLTGPMIAFVTLFGALSGLLIFSLTPWLIGAALGRPDGLMVAWRNGPARALRVAAVVFAVVVPLLYGLNLAFSVLVFASIKISGILTALVLPLGLVLPFLAISLGISAALSALAGPLQLTHPDQ
jgi:hypothetical protein